MGCSEAPEPVAIFDELGMEAEFRHGCNRRWTGVAVKSSMPVQFLSNAYACAYDVRAEQDLDCMLWSATTALVSSDVEVSGGRMNIFNWSDEFVTGLSSVDKQHRHLVDLVNQLGDMLLNNKIHRDDLEALYQQLVSYADYHFREEEGLMHASGVDPRHVEHHILAHRGFLDEVVRLHASIDEGVPEASKNMLEYLSHWLVYHILVQDQNMARQIDAIREGVSPAQAFEEQEQGSHESTAPLLVALQGLFAKLSERNRQLAHLNQTLEARVVARTRELSEANRQLEVLSLTDYLTGLPNRRHAMKLLKALWNESTLNGTPLACMMIDADDFKGVNDVYGHDCGDLVLIEFARTLRHTLRNDDVICRLGGDEFLVLCPATPQDGARTVAEQLRAAVSALRVPTGGEAWHGSASIGVAVRTPAMNDPEDLIKQADDALYGAKRSGTNQVCFDVDTQSADQAG